MVHGKPDDPVESTNENKLTHREDEITVHVKYGDIEKDFSGSVNDVWVVINRFFSELIPAFGILKKIIITIDLENLMKDCEDIIAFAERSSHLLISRDELTDKEVLALQLLADYIGHKLGIIESDATSREKLQLILGKSSKITSTRMGELVKNEIVTKTDDGKYRITAFGIIKTQRDAIPRIKEKIASN